MNVSETGAQKAGNLERYDLIPAEPLRMLAEHYGRGAKKYADRNWEKGYDWGLSFAALNRHLWQFWAGEDVDPETGSLHITAVAWHAFALAEYMDTHPEFDNRVFLSRPGAVDGDGDSRGVGAVSHGLVPLFRCSLTRLGRSARLVLSSCSGNPKRGSSPST